MSIVTLSSCGQRDWRPTSMCARHWLGGGPLRTEEEGTAPLKSVFSSLTLPFPLVCWRDLRKSTFANATYRAQSLVSAAALCT